MILKYNRKKNKHSFYCDLNDPNISFVKYKDMFPDYATGHIEQVCNVLLAKDCLNNIAQLREFSRKLLRQTYFSESKIYDNGFVWKLTKYNEEIIAHKFKTFKYELILHDYKYVMFKLKQYFKLEIIGGKYD